MRLEEARGRFAAAKVARLATADAAGRPHLVALAFAVSDDRIYSVVDAKPKRTTNLRRLRNIRTNPAVSLLVDHYDDADWDTLWWVRADGTAHVMEPAASEAQHAIELLLSRYRQLRPIGAVIAVDVSRWSGWTAVG